MTRTCDLLVRSQTLYPTELRARIINVARQRQNTMAERYTAPMRAVVQRVTRARVVVDGAVVGEIGPGLLVLLGVAKSDTLADAEFLATKIAGLRVFADDAGKMNRSVVEAGGALLVVSQFTLYGDTRKGRRPSFDFAAPPEQARAFIDQEISIRCPAERIHILLLSKQWLWFGYLVASAGQKIDVLSTFHLHRSQNLAIRGKSQSCVAIGVPRDRLDWSP